MDQILSMPAQPLDVAPFGARLTSARSAVLFKAEDLEVIRVVLRKGQSLPPHRVPGSVSLHCLEGRLEVMLGQSIYELQRDQLIHLPLCPTRCERWTIRPPSPPSCCAAASEPLSEISGPAETA